MKSLTIYQEEIAQKIIALPQNGPRSSSYQLSFLNRSGRGLRALRRQFERYCKRIGFSEELTKQCWQDAKDYAKLLGQAEEVAV